VVAIRPAISVGFDIELSYLSNHGIDASAVIGNVQKSLQLAINDAPLNAPITLASLSAVAADVAGVLRVRYIDNGGKPTYISDLVGWSEEEDLPASAGGYLVDVPAMIDASDCVIRQA